MHSWVIVRVPEDGSYALTYYLSTAVDGSAIELNVDGIALGTDSVPNTGNWDQFQAIMSAPVLLTRGEHTFRVTGAGSQGWEWNLDKFTLQGL